MDSLKNSMGSAPLEPGRLAPDFKLQASSGRQIALADFSGKPLVLIFYPADWSPVCGSELALFNELMPVIQGLGAEMLGISVDSHWCHTAFAEERKLRFPLIADFEPKGATAKAYGVYRAEDGTTERALFVIDSIGVVRWSYLSPINVVPAADGVLRALKAIGSHQKEIVA